MLAAGRRFDEWLAGRLIDTLYQEPGPAIRHAHLPGRRTDAAPTLDPFQQLQPALAEDGTTRALNPHPDANRPVAVPGSVIKRHTALVLVRSARFNVSIRPTRS